jgi:hypothetical protein
MAFHMTLVVVLVSFFLDAKIILKNGKGWLWLTSEI